MNNKNELLKYLQQNPTDIFSIIELLSFIRKNNVYY